MKTLVLACSLLAATAANAQTLMARQRIPVTVFVQAGGQEDEIEGQLIAKEDASITLHVGTITYSLPLAGIKKIEIRGGRRTFFGAAIGTLIGGLAGAFGPFNQGLDQRDQSLALPFAFQGAMIGSVVGFFRHDRHTIYPDPAPAKASRQVSPPKTASKARILKGALLGFGAGALLGAAPWSQEACNQKRWCILKAGGLFGGVGVAMAWQ